MIPCPALWEDQEEILALVGVTTFQVLEECYHVSLQSSVLQTKHAHFFQYLPIGLYFQTPIILVALLWTRSSLSTLFLKCGAQNWTQYSR